MTDEDEPVLGTNDGTAVNGASTRAAATVPGADDSSGGKPARTTLARRLVAVALLLGFVGAIWVSFETRYLHTCEDVVARVGTVPLVPSCRPLSLTDTPMVAMLILAGILLFPELSALEIPGVVRLERQLKEQARRQEDIVAAIHRLEISQHQQVNVLVAAKVGELVGEQDEKRRRFESDAS